MPIAILIAASLSFGRITTDLTPVMTALNHTIASLQSRNYRVVTTLMSATDTNHKPVPFEAYETIHIHASSNAGNYYSWKGHNGYTTVECYSDICSFQCAELNGNWTLHYAIQGNDHEDRYRSFSHNAFETLFGLFFFQLSGRLNDGDYVTGCLHLDRNRSLIWGWNPRPAEEGHVTLFRAVVRFSDDRRQAFFERTVTHYRSSQEGGIDSITTSDAKFAADTLEFHSGEETKSFFSIRGERDASRPFWGDRTYQYRIRASTDVAVSDDQLTPEYYGFDRKKLLDALAKRDPAQPVPRDRADLLLAILIPVGLIGLLLVVIRKT